MIEPYSTIRDILGGFIGKTVADISQHDEEDFDRETGEGSFIMLMFTDGSTLLFPSSEGPACVADDANEPDEPFNVETA